MSLLIIEVERFQIGEEAGSEFLVLEGKLDCCLQEAKLLTGVIAFATESIGENALLSQQPP